MYAAPQEVKIMRMQNPRNDVSVATNYCGAGKHHIWVHRFFLAVVSASLTLSMVLAHGQAADAPMAAASDGLQAQAQLVVGGQNIKNNSKGTLSVVGNSLQFEADGKKVSVEASSILDISTDKDSRQDVTGTAYLASEAIPYGGSRVLSLFSHEIDILTVEFRDGNNAYHGAVFGMAKGKAALFRKQLVALGAKTPAPLAGQTPDHK